jgi:hypothetical protein
VAGVIVIATGVAQTGNKRDGHDSKNKHLGPRR